MSRRSLQCAAALGLVLTASACTNPYDPGQRAAGGALIGAGTGAAVSDHHPLGDALAFSVSYARSGSHDQRPVHGRLHGSEEHGRNY